MTPNDLARPRHSLGRRILFRIGAVLLSLVVLAVVLELGTRLLVPESAFRVYSNIFVRDPQPRVGYTLKRSYTGSAFGVDLVTNSLGFRGPEWSVTKPPLSLRIALIGDSHAFGFGVEFEQTMGELLAKRLRARLGRPVEVLNFGVNGHNTRQQLAVVEQRALQFAPDLVLVLVGNTEAERQLWVDEDGFMHWGINTENTGARDISYHPHEESFAAVQKRAYTVSRFLLWLHLQWYRYSLARAAHAREVAQEVQHVAGWLPPAGIGPVDKDLVPYVSAPLSTMVDICRAHRARIGILTFTSLMNWRTTLNAVAQEKGVPLIELAPLLEGADSWKELLEKWSLGWDGHMAAPAQEVWAAKVEEFLVHTGLLP